MPSSLLLCSPRPRHKLKGSGRRRLDEGRFAIQQRSGPHRVCGGVVPIVPMPREARRTKRSPGARRRRSRHGCLRVVQEGPCCSSGAEERAMTRVSERRRRSIDTQKAHQGLCQVCYPLSAPDRREGRTASLPPRKRRPPTTRGRARVSEMCVNIARNRVAVSLSLADAADRPRVADHQEPPHWRRWRARGRPPQA